MVAPASPTPLDPPPPAPSVDLAGVSGEKLRVWAKSGTEELHFCPNSCRSEARVLFMHIFYKREEQTFKFGKPSHRGRLVTDLYSVTKAKVLSM